MSTLFQCLHPRKVFMTNVTKTLRTVHAHRLACAAALSLLAACGAEVAGGAAAVGSLQATQAKEAKAQQPDEGAGSGHGPRSKRRRVVA